ncbi:hypothetical protein GLOIN_2v1480411 [Rhizophagus clarus]|uniref:HMG box domain-containing protein n=1 Tax=Rhizophagus clarus TaxID=94130 RepID=A0A8H3M2G0_9GLOM|nr:hypothetical protein GLOIN_2v1480411 [Rhizophagus clarus]
MPQYKTKVNQTPPTTYSRRCGKKLVTGKVVNATLDSSRGTNNRCFVTVSLNDGAKLDFPVPTTQEIRDRFFYKKAKTQPDKPARPPNKFFIFRTMFQGAIDDFKLQVPIVSGLASEVWKKCSPEVVELFTKLSQIAKSEHGEINPGYVYKPNRSKSRPTKNKPNSLQTKPFQDLNNSSSPILNELPSSFPPTDPLWAAPSKFPQEHLYIPSQTTFNLDENSSMSEDSITTQNFQAFTSHYAYLSAIVPPVHDVTSPLEHINDINDYQQQLFQYPTSTNNSFYLNNNDLSLDQFDVTNTFYDQDTNALIQPKLTSIPHHPIHYLPNNVNDDYNEFIFNSPISESGHASTFHAEQIQESGYIDYSAIFQQNLIV